MDRFKAMESFLQVVRAGSFTAAADEMGLSRAMITRHIQALEAHLRARLLHRTTRFVKLTDAGEAYLQYCERLMADMEEKERTIVQSQTDLHGPLKVSASRGFGATCVADAVAHFSLQHPHIRVSLLIGDFSLRAYDFVEQGLHVAVRFSPNPDSAIASRRIGTLTYVVCASPRYLSGHGHPDKPTDLRNHRCLSHFQLDRGIWKFKGPRGTESVRVDGPLSSNLSIALRKATLAGLGISMLPRYSVEDDIRHGDLVELLNNYSTLERPIYVLLAHPKLMPVTSRTFVNFLAEWFKQPGSPLR